LNLSLVSALFIACHSPSTSPADAGAPHVDSSLAVSDADVRCVRVAIFRGADVCLLPADIDARACVSLAKLERQLRSTNVLVCSPDRKGMRATMNISATGKLVTASAERLDTGILASCLQGALDSTVWPSNSDDYSVTFDIGIPCTDPALN
jgi:hypothetical protein